MTPPRKKRISIELIVLKFHNLPRGNKICSRQIGPIDQQKKKKDDEENDIDFKPTFNRICSWLRINNPF